MQNEPKTEASESSLIAAINALINRMDRSQENDLWDAEDIGVYLRLTKGSVQSHIVNKAGFPKPIILASGGKRWIASEVRAWALRRR